jgi:peptidyl-prolyl cis-trans isomerase SurA
MVFSIMFRPLRAFGAMLVVSLALTTGCKRSAPSNVAATVNNRAITFAELEKNYQSQMAGNTENSSEDQIMIQKMELLRSLVDNEIMLQRAEKLGLMATDSDVETKFNELKAPYTKEEFDRKLAERKMTLDDLKQQLRRDLTIQKLFNKEITSKITITDADVANFYNANKASFHFPEPQIHMAQILVTASPDPNVRNLKNDKAQNPEQAKEKIQMISQRLKNGEDFSMMAQNYSEDPNSAPNGGDLGFVAESSLEKASPELRKMVTSLQAGGLSPIIHTQEGYRILRVISKEAAGQRELNDPRVQQTIRETLLNRKDQLLKAAYYEVNRNASKVNNYLAQSIMDNAGKK